MKKPITRKVFIPIYGALLTIVVSKEFEEISLAYDFENSECAEAQVGTRKDKDGIKEYICILRPDVSVGIMAHEAKHIVNRVFRDRGQLLDSYNDEAECYLLAFVVNEIYKTINKRSK